LQRAKEMEQELLNLKLSQMLSHTFPLMKVYLERPSFSQLGEQLLHQRILLRQSLKCLVLKLNGAKGIGEQLPEMVFQANLQWCQFKTSWNLLQNFQQLELQLKSFQIRYNLTLLWYQQLVDAAKKSKKLQEEYITLRSKDLLQQEIWITNTLFEQKNWMVSNKDEYLMSYLDFEYERLALQLKHLQQMVECLQNNMVFRYKELSVLMNMVEPFIPDLEKDFRQQLYKKGADLLVWREFLLDLQVVREGLQSIPCDLSLELAQTWIQVARTMLFALHDKQEEMLNI